MSHPSPDASTPTNRLIHETSPYLLQHARNPVQWYPWGQEAIDLARESDRPIFLSIGYSACHWCHVMEHESFEDTDIAAVMNELFVNIKVDREERTDLDQIYMNAVQLMTGRGGWPMSVFLTPDLKPFYGGTYFPPRQRMGMPGFRDILLRVSEAWEQRREELLGSADRLTEALTTISAPRDTSVEINESLLRNAVSELLAASDGEHGGFGGAPKFPHPMDLRVLMRSWKRFRDDHLLQVVTLALDKMAAGGIYDHLGGGFHRYSTDHRWLVPHFEKMLYDNALLATCYLEAYQAVGNEDYARIVGETLDYVLREMTQPEGGFYSTQDADSEGVEGKFFVWSVDEITELLGEADARVFMAFYDVTVDGNWEGQTILNRPHTLEEVSAFLGIDSSEMTEVLNRGRQKLLETRSQRIAPARDDKVLVSWNGMMITAMATAGRVLGEERYVAAARSAADFILANMQNAEGILLHSYKDGRARFNAYLDDYACLIDGLTELYQSTFEPRHLESAVQLAEVMIEQFHDPDGGGFFYTGNDHEKLITRQKDAQDNATPSGNSMAITALLKLSRLCSRTDFADTAVRALETLSGLIAKSPLSAGQALIAIDFLLGPTREIVLVDGASKTEGDELLKVFHSRFLPNDVIARMKSGQEPDPGPLGLLFQGKQSIEDSATVYACEGSSCREPVIEIADLVSILEE